MVWRLWQKLDNGDLHGRQRIIFYPFYIIHVRDCLVGTTFIRSLSKRKFIVCVARHKGTRANSTREHHMDTGPKVSSIFTASIVTIVLTKP